MPHTWVIEEVDGGTVGHGTFWICSVCGASGGPETTGAPVRQFLAGTGLQLPDDCEVAKLMIVRQLAKAAAPPEPPSTWPCFVCQKELKRSGGGLQYWDGITFDATGNFGSRLFDTVAMAFATIKVDKVAIVVCDDCVKVRAAHALLIDEMREIVKHEGYVPLDRALVLEKLAEGQDGDRPEDEDTNVFTKSGGLLGSP